MGSRAMSDDWVSVFQGAPQMAELIAGELQDNGIPAFTPDANMRALDPLDVGGAVFDARVLVARNDAQRALDIVRSNSDIASQPEFAVPRADPALAELEQLARRIRWCAVISWFAPYGLWLAARYFPLARESHVRTGKHGLTVAATMLAFVEIAITIGFLAVLAAQRSGR